MVARVECQGTPVVQGRVRRSQSPVLVLPRGGRSLVADVGDPVVDAVVAVVRRRRGHYVDRAGGLADPDGGTCWPLGRSVRRHRQGRSWEIASWAQRFG